MMSRLVSKTVTNSKAKTTKCLPIHNAFTVTHIFRYRSLAIIVYRKRLIVTWGCLSTKYLLTTPRGCPWRLRPCDVIPPTITTAPLITCTFAIVNTFIWKPSVRYFSILLYCFRLVFLFKLNFDFKM